MCAQITLLEELINKNLQDSNSRQDLVGQLLLSESKAEDCWVRSMPGHPTTASSSSTTTAIPLLLQDYRLIIPGNPGHHKILQAEQGAGGVTGSAG